MRIVDNFLTWSNDHLHNRRSMVTYIILILAIAVVATFGLSSIYDHSTPSDAVARTVRVTRGTVLSTVTSSGNISPVTSIGVNFPESGTLTDIAVSVGQQVNAGQVLAKINPAQAQANLASAQAELQAAQQTLTDAENGGTTSQLSQDQATISSDEAQLQNDQQTLDTAESSLSTANTQLRSDEALNCPPASSSSSNTGTSNTGGSSAGSGTGGSSGSGSSAPSPSEVPVSSAPTVSTGSASSIMTTTATLNGTINPNGALTSYYFKYGTSTSAESDTPSTSTGSAGTSQIAVTATISGLSPATTYTFMLVGTNASGTSYGLPQYFTTADSSCTVDQQNIATDEQDVQHDQLTIDQQEASISSAEASTATNPATIAQDQAQVTQDNLTVQTDSQAVAGTTLTAPISGTVISINGTVGEDVPGSGNSTSSAAATSGGSSSSSSGGSGGGSSFAGVSGAGSGSASSSSTTSASTGSTSSGSSTSSFITIENLNQMEVVAGFPEANATSIAVGQPATITLPAEPNTELAGKVVFVSPTSTVVSNVVTYDVTIALNNVPSSVKDGMTADVSVVVASASNTLEVPSAAISTTGPLSTVTALEHGKQVTVRITTGIVGTSTTQVLSGVHEGETLVEHAASSTTTSTASTPTARVGAGGFGGGGFGGGGFGGGGFGGGGFGGGGG